MPPKFISIKNFEKYQKTNNKGASRPWVKLWKSILQDPEFMKLTPEYRYIYTMLILLADDTNNNIYADSTYLRQRLYITHTNGIHGQYIGHTQLDLNPLYRSGFLNTSNLSRTLSEKRRGEERREEEIREEVIAVQVKKPSPPTSDEDWLNSLRNEEAYRGLDLDRELGKCKTWCETNRKPFSRRRFVNWINRAERPMQANVDSPFMRGMKDFLSRHEEEAS